MIIDIYWPIFIGAVKLLTEGLPGIHQRFIPKKRFVCSRESTKRFLRFFPWNDAKKTLVSKLHIYNHCSENLMRFWHLLVKNLKTWWKLSGNLVNFQNLMKDLVKKPGGFTKFFLVKTWWNLKTWCSENLVNSPSFFLVKTWWNLKTWWKPGEFTEFFLGENLVKFENLVKTWWKPGEFTRFWKNHKIKNQEAFLHLWNSPKEAFWAFFWWNLSVLAVNLKKKITKVTTWWKPGENLVNSPSFLFLVKTWWNLKTWWKLGENWTPGENLVNSPSFFCVFFCEISKPGENLVKTWWIHQGFFFEFTKVVKTWWNFKTWWKTWWKPGEFTKFFLWWTLGDFWKPGENLVNSPGFFLLWWKLGEISKLGENLVTTWWIHQVFYFWWKPAEIYKLGENLVNSPSFFLWWKLGDIWKPGENLVKAWWIHQVFFIFGENLLKSKFGEFTKFFYFGENLVSYFKTW